MHNGWGPRQEEMMLSERRSRLGVRQAWGAILAVFSLERFRAFVSVPAADQVKCLAAADNPEDGFCHLIIRL